LQIKGEKKWIFSKAPCPFALSIVHDGLEFTWSIVFAI